MQTFLRCTYFGVIRISQISGKSVKNNCKLTCETYAEGGYEGGQEGGGPGRVGGHLTGHHQPPDDNPTWRRAAHQLPHPLVGGAVPDLLAHSRVPRRLDPEGAVPDAAQQTPGATAHAHEYHVVWGWWLVI